MYLPWLDTLLEGGTRLRLGCCCKMHRQDLSETTGLPHSPRPGCSLLSPLASPFFPTILPMFPLLLIFLVPSLSRVSLYYFQIIWFPHMMDESKPGVLIFLHELFCLTQRPTAQFIFLQMTRLSFFSLLIFHCVCEPCFPCPFIWRWAPKLVLVLGYSE